MRAQVVAGAIGGLLAGYVGWLIAVDIGDRFSTAGTWSLVVLVLSAGLAAASVIRGRRILARRDLGWAAFAFGLPVLPVVLTLAVLASVYL
ncbi:hypothetical protein [Mycobacterium sp.]|uniref:hypothetical protein n=1 Tax=Mycobacterium sp. TaxID=1785 RepID=UPI003A8A5396